MNTSYLLSVIDLYLKKANEKLNIEVIKYDEYIKFNFFYDSSQFNKTYISVDKDSFWRFSKIIFSKIQKKSEITNEIIDDDNNYIVEFKNKKVTFCWFEKNELINIRNNFDVKNEFTFDKVQIKEIQNSDSYDNKLVNKNNKFAFSMGFSSFITIFLSAIWFLDVFMIALWIFKSLK